MASLFKCLYGEAIGMLEFRALPEQSRAFFEVNAGYGFEMNVWIKGKVAAGQHVYFGVATRDGQGGKKENILNIPALWCDIDFKETPQTEADKLIGNFMLAPSAVVLSGGGYHLYWTLNEPLGQSEIEEVEGTLKRIAVVLHGDMNATDASRILRVPGTMNIKYDPPRPVTVRECSCAMYCLDDFDFLADVEIPINMAKSGDGNKAAVDAVMECAFMKHCLDNAQTLAEPLWYAAITQLARIPGGQKMIHEISRPYPKYSPQETDKKILHALDTGPMSCVKIRELWNCPLKCGLTSPACLAFASPRTPTYEATTTPPSALFDRVSAWVCAAPGEISLSDIDREFGFTTSDQRAIRSQIIDKLVAAGSVDAVTSRRNTIRVRNLEEKKIVLGKTKFSSVQCVLPFGLESSIELSEKNIVVVAGETNTGKTAILLDLAFRSQKICPKGGKITYFSSEMGEQEINRRCASLGTTEQWAGVEFVDRSADFDDLISRDPERRNGIVIIDYLEASQGEAFRIGNDIKKIYDSLDRGICFIAIQKKPGTDIGMGGFDTMSKARLYLTLSSSLKTEYGLVGSCKVAKVKFIKSGVPNPDGKELDFIVTKQGHPEMICPLHYMNKKDKLAHINQYKVMFGVDDAPQQITIGDLSKYITNF